jgi:hypothetical protein
MSLVIAHLSGDPNERSVGKIGSYDYNENLKIFLETSCYFISRDPNESNDIGSLLEGIKQGFKNRLNKSQLPPASSESPNESLDNASNELHVQPEPSMSPIVNTSSSQASASSVTSSAGVNNASNELHVQPEPSMSPIVNTSSSQASASSVTSSAGVNNASNELHVQPEPSMSADEIVKSIDNRKYITKDNLNDVISNAREKLLNALGKKGHTLSDELNDYLNAILDLNNMKILSKFNEQKNSENIIDISEAFNLNKSFPNFYTISVEERERMLNKRDMSPIVNTSSSQAYASSIQASASSEEPNIDGNNTKTITSPESTSSIPAPKTSVSSNANEIINTLPIETSESSNANNILSNLKKIDPKNEYARLHLSQIQKQIEELLTTSQDLEPDIKKN